MRAAVGFSAAISATWRSGYAAACKAVYTGSIPVVALPACKKLFNWAEKCPSEQYFAHVDLSRPQSAIAPSRDLDVLKVLAGTSRPMSGRHVARVSGIAPSSVRVALERLVTHGLVRKEVAGQASMYTLNREHLAAPAAEILANMWPELLRRLKDCIGDWRAAPVHSSLFGSAARRDGGVASDIDVLLVRSAQVDVEEPGWRAQVDGLEDSLSAWTGNHPAIVEISEADLGRNLQSASPFLLELRRDAVLLAGATLDEVLHGR